MDSAYIITTILGIISALTPAILVVTKQHRSLRDALTQYETGNSVSISELKSDVARMSEVLAQRIDGLETAIKNQQAQGETLQAKFENIAVEVAKIETRLDAVEKMSDNSAQQLQQKSS